MTPAERERAHALAVRANHPSVFAVSTQNQVGRQAGAAHDAPAIVESSAAHLRREPAGDGGSAAAESSSTPSAFSDFHATVTDINDAADRLRVLLRRGSPDDAVEAHRDLSRGATSPGVQP